MTNTPRDPAAPRGPSRASAKVDRRSHIAIAVAAVVLVVGAILYFSAASDQDTSGTPPASTEAAPASNAPADNNAGTTTQ